MSAKVTVASLPVTISRRAPPNSLQMYTVWTSRLHKLGSDRSQYAQHQGYFCCLHTCRVVTSVSSLQAVEENTLAGVSAMCYRLHRATLRRYHHLRDQQLSTKRAYMSAKIVWQVQLVPTPHDCANTATGVFSQDAYCVCTPSGRDLCFSVTVRAYGITIMDGFGQGEEFAYLSCCVFSPSTKEILTR